VVHPAIVSVDMNQLRHSFFGDKNQVRIKNLKQGGLINSKLDSVICISSNNIRFRGPDLPANDSGLYKIFAVGGSTTICGYLSDGDDWPNVIGRQLHQEDSSIWINNAGNDGHSTFGHLNILPEMILPHHPQMVLFLVGCNDVFRNEIRPNDDTRNYIDQHAINTNQVLYKYCNVYRLIVNLSYYLINKDYTQNFKVYHQNIDFSQVSLVPTDTVLQKQKLQLAETQYIPAYKERLRKIITLCKGNGIIPVFITQPSVLGFGTDTLTGADLAHVQIDEYNGEIYWSILEAYNHALKSVCNETNCRFIDLADSMPKNTNYYYDFFHFTRQGSKMVADIICKQLPAIIEADKTSNRRAQ
jgi:lysophospholipase L1-like esterase